MPSRVHPDQAPQKPVICADVSFVGAIHSRERLSVKVRKQSSVEHFLTPTP
jgi:hypothetical protein